MEIAKKFTMMNLQEKTDSQMKIKQIIAPQTSYNTTNEQNIRFLDIPLLGICKNMVVQCEIDIIDGITGLPLTTAADIANESYKACLAGLSTQLVRNVEIQLNNTPYQQFTNASHYFGIKSDELDYCDEN